MNLRESLLQEHSKKQCDAIVAWVGNDEERFNELFQLFLHSEYRITQRAAWPLSFCVINHPALIKSNYSQLITNLKKPALMILSN